MKLSTRSRYGTRLMADLAGHFNKGPVQLGEIARRQGISIKYLEQLIIPLKKAKWVKSVRGPKGGHMLAVSPASITVGEIVEVLENGISLTRCIENPKICDRYNACQIRDVWKSATQAMSHKLHSIKLSEIIK
jgi:Rrf2 family iron-sulfur cluster assembly transcriptional regulator